MDWISAGYICKCRSRLYIKDGIYRCFKCGIKYGSNLEELKDESETKFSEQRNSSDKETDENF